MTRKPSILRSRDMRSDDFGALFIQMFDSLYADMPPLADGISIGGVYGCFEGTRPWRPTALIAVGGQT